MWKNILFIIPTLYVLKNKKIKETNISTLNTIPENDCLINFLNIINNLICHEIYENIFNILNNDNIINIISNNNSTNISSNTSLLKIKNKKYNDWINSNNNSKDLINKKKKIILDLTQQIINKLFRNDINNTITIQLYQIISKLINNIYSITIKKYNNSIFPEFCKIDNKKECTNILQNLLKLYPHHDNTKLLLDKNISNSIIENYIIEAYNEFKSIENIELNKCNKIVFIKTSKIDSKILELLDYKPKIFNNRLDNLNFYANKLQKKQKLEDLSLKDIINNTSTTMLKLIDIIPTYNIYKSNDNFSKSSLYDLEKIIEFILKDNNIFYIGIFILFFTFLLVIISYY